MNQCSWIFQKKICLRIESILAEVILFLGFDLNTEKPVNIPMQCGVRIGYLCLVVFFFNFRK